MDKVSVDQLDVNALTEYLRPIIPELGTTFTVEKFAGGQSNPTFKLSNGKDHFVLRRQPPGKLLKSAHAVDREFRIQSALLETPVPVAKPIHLCEDASIIGSMFYVMELVEGNIYWKAALPEVSNTQRGVMYEQMIDVLAAIHSVDIEKVGLSDYGKPGNYFQRQFDRWQQQYRAAELAPIAAMEDLMNWLRDHLPEDDGRCTIVHGDYRLDNLIFAPDNQKILAVIDWELSTLGHPFADIAYQCMQLRMPANIGTISGLMGVDRAALSIPSEEEFVQRYCQTLGIDGIDHWAFYLAFSYFRLAAIVQGVAKRAVEGNASSKQAQEVGQYVQPLAEFALDVINKA
ncbi:phosphotransferase family protein [Marinibactrum halimedae]|uniref:Aminoglycoside phosphotransferase n=1 Tax=Marinibactrum halimedae TaxID=1444977 RepID=A0AA37T428_9GAMM|nr:phosphotransferase family protein [Marinibactrum halimedae]MCD9459106.1 phosphotransferase family protein [Marinibactrum halimedae]GLS24707.1 aminoglycoside phosphotransferase [Marinibactrum halimedae]